MNKQIENFNKICTSCGEEFQTKHITKSYCKKCYSKYQLEYRDKNKGNYIYMFLPKKSEHEGEILYIGSTTNIKQRMSSHLTLKTKASHVISQNKREYEIVYAQIDNGLLQNRNELYFIEYYLIHKYYSVFGVNPFANDRDTFACDIELKKQIELISIAEQLKYQSYDICSHKKILL